MAGKKGIIAAINQAYLFDREREWGNHGIRRSFRFWKKAEKVEYLQRACELADALMVVTPDVSFGFGSVLGIVRDRDFIPHDDDMDLIIGLPSWPGTSFAQAKMTISTVLEAQGFTTHGENLSHYTVTKGPPSGTDVFIGFVESDRRVSWFPSKRGLHKYDDVFPAQTVDLFGIECLIPRMPERYLEKTYGQDWRKPIPNWNHPWDQSEYREFIVASDAPETTALRNDPAP